jgi:uncharacterized RDD family membrane protein YckC
VRRHQERKRRKLDAQEVDTRQLSIFPEEPLEDEEERNLKQRRAEIRARVEERVARRRTASPVERVVDAGELPLGAAGSRGAAAAAVARDLDRDPSPESPLDPRTARFEPLTELPDGEVEERADSDAGVDPFPGIGLASVFERVFSGFIDIAFVSLIQLTLFYLTTHLVAQRLGALPGSALSAMGVVGAVLAAGYFLFFWSLSGQTLGKLLMGSRVVDRRGGALGFGRAALRLAATLLAILPLGAGFVGLLTDPERRGWHDRIAGTKVVRG